MKKFSFATLFLVCAVALATGAQAAPKMLKVAHADYPGTAQYRAWEDAKKFIEENSGGKYTLDLNDSYKLGPTQTTMQGAQFGTVHMVEDGSPNFASFDPAIGIFDLPFLFPDYESVDIILNGPIGQKILDHMSQKSGTKALAFMGNGFRGILTNKPLAHPAEAAGMKIRSTPSRAHMAGLNSMGFSATPMPWTETITGVQQRVIDGFDLDLAQAMNMGLGEIAPYVLVTEHMYTPHLAVANQDWWDGLNDEDRALFEKMFRLLVENSTKYAREDDIKARTALVEKGHKLTALDPAERAKWMEMTRDTYKEIPQIPAEWVEEIRAELKKMGKLQ